MLDKLKEHINSTTKEERIKVWKEIKNMKLKGPKIAKIYEQIN